ncbi:MULTISPECIES: hypothetical protein [unclassified Flavobacterium]|uniref:hypothetical protein n=1 Tax=unclassified Flavobacterium TaxID=196869 RepID=UPI00361B1FCE
MKYRIAILILTSLLIGTAIGWYAATKYTSSKIEKVVPTSAASSTAPDNTKTAEKKEDNASKISMNDLGECANDIVTLEPLVVRYAQNATCNCDTAQTTLEISFCSSIEACIERKKFDLLTRKILAQYDPEITEQNMFVQIAEKNNDPSILQSIPDYKAAKALQEKAFLLFLDYVEMESEIVGIKMGKGRERSIHENSKTTGLLKTKNQELEALLKE